MMNIYIYYTYLYIIYTQTCHTHTLSACVCSRQQEDSKVKYQRITSKTVISFHLALLSISVPVGALMSGLGPVLLAGVVYPAPTALIGAALESETLSTASA